MKVYFLFLLLVASVFSFHIKGQNSKYSIDLYSSDKVAGFSPFYLQGNYRLLKSFESSIYAGFNFTRGGRVYDWTKNDYYKGSTVLVGLSLRYFIFQETKILSPYFSGKLGVSLNKLSYENLPKQSSTMIDYGLYGGFKLKIYKPLSAFAEIGYARFDLVRFGLSLQL